ASYIPGKRAVLRRNPYYRGGRPHHVDSFVVDLAKNGDEILPAIQRGAADWGYVKASYLVSQFAQLKRQYGLNRSRFWTAPGLAIHYFVLNTQSALFRNNVHLRKAVNYAVDRRALAAAFGPGAARPTDQYLPLKFPGFRDADIYPLGGNLRKARALAHGHLRSKKVVVYTRSDLAAVTAQAQILKANLARIGLRVELKALPGSGYFQRLGNVGEPFDIAWDGWAPDYADPDSVLHPLLDGRKLPLPPDQNTNHSHFSSRSVDRLLDRDSRLSGSARDRAFGRLDVDVARQAAPMIAYADRSEFTILSGRVGCVVVRPD